MIVHDGPHPPLTPAGLSALLAYAETGDRRNAAAALGVCLQTFNARLAWAYRTLDVCSALDAFRVMGWLDTIELPKADRAATRLADIVARLAAIHADTGALLRELDQAGES